MSQEIPSNTSSGRVGGGGNIFSKAIARSASKRHKGHVPSSSVPAVPFTFNVDELKRDGKTPPAYPRPGTAKAPEGQQVAIESIKLEIPQNLPSKSPVSANSAVSATMIVAPFGNTLTRQQTSSGTSVYSNPDYAQKVTAVAPSQAAGSAAVGVTAGTANPAIIYQHIQDMASKRISTLDYLRKAHEGRIYWFNTLHFSKTDLSRLPFFEPRRLARRATNYLLLGLSLPTILDPNSTNPLEYLRSLNALLIEFEAFQNVHPPDGSSSSSLSRARIPQMFKRATHAASASSKARRTSSATEIGLPMQSSDPVDLKSMSGSIVSSGTANTVPSIPSSSDSSDLLPGEEYMHLLTPSLPFDPDFFETFATLCDVLIDAYTRIVSLISTPATCTPGVGEAFGKADARLRKVILAGMVREFEDASRIGAKGELAAVGKVILGGLMEGGFK